MNKIAIISGDGNLPLYIGKSLSKKNFKVTYLILNSIKNKKIYKNEDHIIINILSIKKIIDTLKKNNLKQVIFAGSLKRPSINDLGFDLDTIKLAKQLLLEKKGDNNLLISIKKFLETKGFIFFNWTRYCSELFSIEKNLINTKPTKFAQQNFIKAKSIYKHFKNIDVGQSIIVQNQLVLGLEAIEGTDNLIKRCSYYKRKGDRGVLVKFTKKNQSSLIDIPLVGLATMKSIKKYDYEGIFLEKNKCLIINKNQVIEYANKNKIFISSVDLI
tara:strand:- start:1688 stop:2503 length:816 start_codon:yes stop_codon:yes gene_type:complete